MRVGMGRRVAVIGAGPAGLVAARCLSQQGHAVSVFERASAIGGTWCYSEALFSPQGHFQSAMYKSLRTNLPKEAMQYSDFPFDESTPTFPTHHQVLSYLQKYSKHHKLERLIKLNHDVTAADRIGTYDWAVTVFDQLNNTSSTEHFEAVCVCNGHFSTPFIPHIEGLDAAVSAGELECLHSRIYRHSDQPPGLKGKRLLIYGGGFSALDIASELSLIADSVILSCVDAKLPANIVTRIGESGRNLDLSRVVRKPLIEAVRRGGVVEFVDGSSAAVDAIMFCTGYRYVCSFLPKDMIFGDNQQLIRPLYKHLYHASFADGSLSFLGLGRMIVPFPFCEVQASHVGSVLNGDISLPSSQAMLAWDKDWNASVCARGWPQRRSHELDHNTYCRDLLHDLDPVLKWKFVVGDNRSLRRSTLQ